MYVCNRDKNEIEIDLTNQVEIWHESDVVTFLSNYLSILCVELSEIDTFVFNLITLLFLNKKSINTHTPAKLEWLK